MQHMKKQNKEETVATEHKPFDFDYLIEITKTWQKMGPER